MVTYDLFAQDPQETLPKAVPQRPRRTAKPSQADAGRGAGAVAGVTGRTVEN